MFFGGCIPAIVKVFQGCDIRSEDALIRQAKHGREVQEAYLNLLRGWFKNNSFTPKVAEAIKAVRMTQYVPAFYDDGRHSGM